MSAIHAINVLDSVIRKAERPQYSDKEIREFHALLDKLNAGRGRRDQVSHGDLDRLIFYAQHPDPVVSREGQRGLGAALRDAVNTGLVVAGAILAAQGARELSRIYRFRQLLTSRVRSGVNLITTIPKKAHPQLMRMILDLAERSDGDIPVKDLTAMIEDTFDVSEGVARRIALDQARKLDGAVAEANQVSAGVRFYIWQTMQDDRVRPHHRERQSRRFSWKEPPAGGHPGTEINCRCVALPVLPERSTIKMLVKARPQAHRVHDYDSWWERRQDAIDWLLATGDGSRARELGMNPNDYLPSHLRKQEEDELIQKLDGISEKADSLLDKSGPPGPPPRPGLEWKEETKRWVRGQTELPIEVNRLAEVAANPVSEYYQGLAAKYIAEIESDSTFLDAADLKPNTSMEVGGPETWSDNTRAEIQAEIDLLRQQGKDVKEHLPSLKAVATRLEILERNDQNNKIARARAVRRFMETGRLSDLYANERGRLGTVSGHAIYGRSIAKDGGPPGPPPREGLEWKDETSRWIRPDEGSAEGYPKRRTKKPLKHEEYTASPYEDEAAGQVTSLIWKLRSAINNREGAFESLSDDELDWMNALRADTNTSWTHYMSIMTEYEYQPPESKMTSISSAVEALKAADEPFTELMNLVPDDGSDVAKNVRDARNFMRKRRRGLEAVYQDLKRQRFVDRVDRVRKAFKDLESTVKGISDEIDATMLRATERLDESLDRYDEGDLEWADSSLYSAWFEVGFIEERVRTARHPQAKEIREGTLAIGGMLGRLQNQIRIDQMKPPVQKPGRAIGSGKALKTHPKLGDWPLNVKFGDSERSTEAQMAESQRVLGYIKEGSEKIMSQLKPDYQLVMNKSLQDRPITIHAGSGWREFVDDWFTSGIPYGLWAGNVAAFAAPSGIHTPDHAEYSTIVHEIGHQLDHDLRDVNLNAYLRMQNLYADRKRTMSEEEFKKANITPYASSSVNELFAESFMTYLLNPSKLFHKDPEAYLILKEEVFQ